MTINIYMIAGESSGENIGVKLMHNLVKLAPQNKTIKFHGIGGVEMEKMGMHSLFPMSDISLIGFTEIWPKIPFLLKRIEQTVVNILQLNPEIVITIDAPGFNFRVAKALRDRGYQGKLVHYVAPTVWAYKPERAKKIAKLYDHLLVLLPFEPPYFLQEGLATTFVGHPIIEEQNNITIISREEARQNLGIGKDKKVVCFLSGSRLCEVNRLMPIFKKTALMLKERLSDLTLIFPTSPNLAKILRAELQNWPIDSLVCTDKAQKKLAYQAADIALCKSGTIALELSLYDLPMIITYKVNFLTAWWLKRLLNIPYVSLVNLMVGQEVIPELLQEKCNANELAEALIALYQLKDLREAQIKAFHKVLSQLGKDEIITPSQKAATKIFELLDNKAYSASSNSLEVSLV